MVALKNFRMNDLARQKRVEVELAEGSGSGLTPNHTVGQAVDLFKERLQLGAGGGRWSAFSRGLTLDSKSRLGDLAEADNEWTVMPEVSAG